jgi:hypothetical protein
MKASELCHFKWGTLIIYNGKLRLVSWENQIILFLFFKIVFNLKIEARKHHYDFDIKWY